MESVNDAIAHLNRLAADSAKIRVPIRTTEELRNFFENPPEREYNGPLEEAITAVVRQFETADERARRKIISELSEHARNGFLGYAADMAVLAVRRQSPVLIEQGLTALVIEGASHDFRDSIVALAKLYHSAMKLAMDPGKPFEKAAGLAEPGIMRTEILAFPHRRPEDLDLKAFYQSEETSEDGFRYRQVLPSSSAVANPQPARPVETPQQISARLTWHQQQAMIQMAGIQAEMAVRKQSPKLVEQGLQSVALGGGALDPSHSLPTLAKLYHAAVKLGMNPEVAFAEAAEFAPLGALKTEMNTFPLRASKDRHGA